MNSLELFMKDTGLIGLDCAAGLTIIVTDSDTSTAELQKIASSQTAIKVRVVQTLFRYRGHFVGRQKFGSHSD